MKRVVIIGAGIAGLALARVLRARSRGRAELLLLERGARPGGNIRSERIDGHLCEWGPHGYMDSAPATRALVADLGLTGRLAHASEEAKSRFVMIGGALRELPRGPGGLLFGSLLTPAGRVRLLAEPFVRRRPPAETDDETITAFATRRLGRQAASRIVGPAVSGIFAGDPDSLSLRACFPELWEMERQSGSLTRAMLARARRPRERTGPARLTSFAGGLGEMIDALAADLGETLRLRVPLTSMRPAASGGRGFELLLEDQAPVPADTVVLACHAHHAAGILEAMAPRAARLLRGIATAPVVVVCMGWKDGRVRAAMNGFGFLVAREERRRTLGILFESNVFPDRAPAGGATARAIIGGALDPEAVTAPDETLLEAALDDLRAATGLAERPEFVKIVRHPLGIPQYITGHLDRLAAIEEDLARHPGLFLAGSSYRGVSINGCVAGAEPLADRILSSLPAAD